MKKKTRRVQRRRVETYYCEEMRTRWRGSLGRWQEPVDVQESLAVRQLEHGQSLSQRI